MNIEIANRLVELRKKNKLSQEELANKLGLSRQAISKWERAESSPDTDNLICLAKLYNISLDELLDIDAKKEEPETQTFEEVIDMENGKKIRIDEDGLSIEKGGKKIHIKNVKIEKSNDPLTRKQRKFLDCFDAFVMLVTVSSYILMGVFNNLWHPGWIIFLGSVVLMSLMEAILYKSMNKFAFPVLVVGVYLLLGFLNNLWHPGWVIFLLIPLYYTFVPLITVTINKDKKEKKE